MRQTLRNETLRIAGALALMRLALRGHQPQRSVTCRGQIVKACVLCVVGAFALAGCGTSTATTSDTQTSSAESQSTEMTAPEATDTESTPVPPSSSAEGEDNESEGESQSEPEEDEPGSTSHAGDEKFCEEHECEGEFDTEPGAVVECSDGTWSHAGGISGACSHHGGEG